MSDLSKETGIELDKGTTHAVVGHMINDRGFAEKCRAKIKANQFPGVLAEIVHAIYDLCSDPNLSNMVLNKSQVISHLHYLGNRKDEFAYLNSIAECERLSIEYPVALVSKYLEGWLLKVASIEHTNKLVKIVNNENYDNIKPHLQNIGDLVNSINFTDVGDETSNFAGIYEKLLTQDDKMAGRSVTIGHPLFDEMLSEGSMINNTDFNFAKDYNANVPTIGIGEHLARETTGGLRPGGATAILGTVNSGKTTTICTIGAANVLMGKYVLLVTLEQDASEIRDKFIANMLNKSVMEMRNMVRDIAALGGPLAPIIREKPEMYGFLLGMAQAEKLVKEYLVHIHHNKTAQMTLEHVNQLVLNAIQKKKKVNTFGFNLVIIDYPARLRAEKFSRNGQRHIEEGMIYQHFIDLAREHGYHTILPVQTNRGGYKANQGTEGGGRMIDMGDTGGSFAIAQAHDNVITINRTPEDKANSMIRYLISKNRGGPTEGVFASKTNMARSQAFGIYLPAVTYSYTQNVDSQMVARWMGESALSGRGKDKRGDQAMQDLRNMVEQRMNDEEGKARFESTLDPHLVPTPPKP